MRRLFMIIFVLISIVGISFEFSVLGGMELGGRNRPFIGTRAGTLSGGLSVMFEVYYPLSSIEEIEGINIEEIRFIEFDPYLYLAIPFFSNLIYVGVAPIIIVDIDNLEFTIYSTEVFHAKAGLRFGQGIVFFIEGMTTVTTSLQTLGIYAVSAGIGIGF